MFVQSLGSRSASALLTAAVIFALGILGSSVARPVTAADVVASVTKSTDWPQFRGPNASGVSASGQPPLEFGPTKNLLWKVPMAAGLSCPSISGDTIYLTGFADGKLFVAAHSLADGKQQWKTDVPAKSIEAFHKTEGSPAASTVATDGQHVLAYFGSYGLVCLSPAGKQLWTYELGVADTNNGFGTGTSPVLVDGLVILVRDLAKNSQMVALSVASGKPVWQVKRPSALTGYGTPVVWDRPEGKQLIVPASLMLQGYSLKDGKELWSVRNLPAVSCTSPVIAGDLVVYAGWSPGDDEFKMPAFAEILKQGDADNDGKISQTESAQTFLANFFENNDTDKDGYIEPEEWDAQIEFLTKGVNRMVAVKPGAKGDATSTHVAWERKRGMPYVPSALAYDGRVYLIKDGGLVSCFDAATGKPHFEQQRLEATGGYYASPVAAAGHVFLSSLEGKVTVLKAGNTLQAVAVNDLEERIASTPAISGNKLVIRSANHLWCFGK